MSMVKQDYPMLEGVSKLIVFAMVVLGLALVGLRETASAASAKRDLPATYTAEKPVPVSIAVSPDKNEGMYAVEDAPPAGWVVSTGTIDNAGGWDKGGGKVKWFFTDATARTLSYTVTPPSGTKGVQTFSGQASFANKDVATTPIGGDKTIKPK